nr:Sea17 [Serratia proteamaculans]
MEFMLNDLVHFNDNTRVLCRGVQSIELSLSSARLLSRLIITPNKLIRRDDLLNDVWDKFNLTPSDSNLNKNISLLRKAFTDLRIENSIETMPKQGFMLVLTVKVLSGDLSEVPLSSEKVEGSTVKKNFHRQWFIIIFALEIMFVAFFSYIFKSAYDNHNFSYFTQVGLCGVYVAQSAKIKSIETFIKSSSGKNVMRRCENTHKIVYIDDSKLDVENLKKETFVAVCDGNKSSGRNECKNYVFL